MQAGFLILLQPGETNKRYHKKMEKGRFWGKRWMRNMLPVSPRLYHFHKCIYETAVRRLILKVLLDGCNKVLTVENPIYYSLYEYTKKILKNPIL